VGGGGGGGGRNQRIRQSQENSGSNKWEGYRFAGKFGN